VVFEGGAAQLGAFFFGLDRICGHQCLLRWRRPEKSGPSFIV